MRDQAPAAVRFGVKANPPTLLVEYFSRQGLKRPSRREDGLRHKVFRLRHLGSSKTPSSKQQHSAQDVAHRLARKFPDHFGTRMVKHAQLAGLILKLEGLILQSSRTTTSGDGADENNPGGNSQILLVALLRQQDFKTVSDTSVEEEGQTTCSVVGEVKSSAAKSFAKDNNSEELAVAVMKTNGHQLSESMEAAARTPFEDLNHASESDLAAAKAQMNVAFQQNLRKPGAPGYIHDLRKDFSSAEEDCDWDSDSDSDSHGNDNNSSNVENGDAGPGGRG